MMKVTVEKSKQIYKGFFTLEKATVRFEKFAGTMSEPVSRLNVYRGDAVAVLLYDSGKKTCYFVKQFRYPIHTVEPENSWTIEVVAGSVGKNDNPTSTAINEVEEEVGFEIKAEQLKSIGRCYPSPGGTSERIYLFASDIAGTHKPSAGGGVASEHEDIEVIQLTYDQTIEHLEQFKINDAKTLLTLYWFKENIYQPKKKQSI
jgi:ADP-ribose pyrophosphatase